MSEKQREDVVVVESVNGYFSYHLAYPGNKTKALCGSKTLMMPTKVPTAAWGCETHLGESYCRACEVSVGLTPSAKRVVFCVDDVRKLSLTAVDGFVPPNQCEAQQPGLDEMRRISSYLLARPVSVRLFRGGRDGFIAAYGPVGVVFNADVIPAAWFRMPLKEPQIALLLHELAHETTYNHEAPQYRRALSLLGARLALAFWSGAL
jgi:hypothetical protein